METLQYNHLLLYRLTEYKLRSLHVTGLYVSLWICDGLCLLIRLRDYPTWSFYELLSKHGQRCMFVLFNFAWGTKEGAVKEKCAVKHCFVIVKPSCLSLYGLHMSASVIQCLKDQKQEMLWTVHQSIFLYFLRLPPTYEQWMTFTTMWTSMESSWSTSKWNPSV